MSSEKPLKRLVFRWTALKGLTAIVLFFILALFIEYVIVYLFLSSGLTDDFLISQAFQIPATDVSFTITVSPVFHLMPLGVIVVLVSSWTYLTKYIAVVPWRISPPRKPQEARRERYVGARRVRFKKVRQLSKKLRRKLQGVSHRMSAAVRRIRGVSYVLQRLSFAKATVKSATTVLVIFLISIFAISMLNYPSLIHDSVIGFYRANPWFHGFVLKILATAQAIGKTLSPIGWISSNIDNALHAAAVGFWNTLEGVGISITNPFVKLDLVWKYAACQNFAAWISAVVALAYGFYASRLYQSHKR
jgi:hypothetical protein